VTGQGSGSATALVGMTGFVVVSTGVVDGELHLQVETTATVVGCPDCGVRAVGHGRRRVRVRDLPISGRPSVLCWEKRLWRCPEADCPRCTWTERSELVEPSGLLTVRAGAEVCRQVGEDATPVARAAARFGIGWWAAMARVRAYGTPLVDDPARTASCAKVGVDETTFRHAARARRTEYVTGIVDLDRRLLVDVVEGRSGRVLGDWLASQPSGWLQAQTVASLDAFRGYANALQAGLPAATVVMDHFHTLQLANRAVDQVRRRINQAALGHRGRNTDPLYRIRRLLLTHPDKLSPRAWAKLIAGAETGDRSGHVQAAWVAVQHLRAVYAAPDLPAARRALVRFYTHVADHHQVPELVTLAGTISAWEAEVLAYHHTGHASNGPTEAVNLLIEKHRRIGHGFRNFDNYRLRLLLTCGLRWDTPQVARLRGRKPRLAA
jgi:transposase